MTNFGLAGRSYSLVNTNRSFLTIQNANSQKVRNRGKLQCQIRRGILVHFVISAIYVDAIAKV